VHSQSQLSADAACFIPSWHWHAVNSGETSTAVASGGAAIQQRMLVNTTEQFNNKPQAEQW